jgi:hypothetical protein
MLKFGCLMLVAAATACSAAGVATAASPYDGRWSVVIQTERGQCDQAYRYGLMISNGNVTYAGDSSFDVRGRVAPNGAVHVRVARGAAYADGNGHLSQNTGSGVWRGVGSGSCSGRWFAERRG